MVNGLVFGKFLPFHKGHQLLVETALKNVDKLTIAICNKAGEEISPEQRELWITTLYPECNVVILPSTLPYEPYEATDFYDQWGTALIVACGCKPDVIFTSESYGDVLCGEMKVKHVLVDIDRKIVPISGTKVRENPLAAWDYLDPVVRSYFVKKICIYGPESTGKTILAQKLAGHYDTLWVPEYARLFLEKENRYWQYEDMAEFAKGQFDLIQRLKLAANKLLFIDTDAITTKIYSDYYYSKHVPIIDTIIDSENNQFDLYLLLTPDVPWVANPQRDLGDKREEMFELFKKELEDRKAKNPNFVYGILSGSWEERETMAIEIIDSLFEKK